LEPLSPTTLKPGRLFRFAWVLYMAIALAASLWIGLRQGVIPLSLFLSTEDWWVDLGAGLAAGALLLASWWGAERVFPLARELGDKLAAVLGPISAMDAIALALLSGFAEELFFRVALLHGGPGPAFRFWTLFALAAGALLGGLMAWRGNLLGPIAGHVLVNAVNLRRLASRRGDSGRLPGESE
jgi:hypothetical protein